MVMYYSEKTGGFYAGELIDRFKAAGKWPDDAREITREEESQLRASIRKIETVEIPYDVARAKAYADPQTGSDRHFAEAARKTAKGDTAGAAAATQAGLARVAEIKAEYPLP